jgi:hypothetical protein
MADSGIYNILNQGVQALNALQKVLSSAFPQTVGTATTATAGSATLPANPVGFLVITLPDGTSKKVAYYS